MKYDLNYDYDSQLFHKIFSDTSKPFSERLDKAVELANAIVENKLKVMEIFRIYDITGCIVRRTSENIVRTIAEQLKNYPNENPML